MAMVVAVHEAVQNRKVDLGGTTAGNDGPPTDLRASLELWARREKRGGSVSQEQEVRIRPADIDADLPARHGISSPGGP